MSFIQYNKTYTQSLYYLSLQLKLRNLFPWLTTTDMLPDNI